MIISDDPKFIFVHIPRTGGTSTRRALKEYCEPHYDNKALEKWHFKLSQYNEILNLDLTSYFKWTRVRNPWDRLVSIYSRRKRDKHFAKKFPECSNLAKEKSFEEWLKVIISRNKEPVEMYEGIYRHIFNQRQYIENENLDFVSRFENINEDFDYFCKQIGIPNIELPKINGFGRRPCREYYNDELIDKLLRVESFKKDLDFLGYDYKP